MGRGLEGQGGMGMLAVLKGILPMKIDLVDVFANGPLSGNPLAVVHGGEDWTPEVMQRLAAWIGFSETVFLLKPCGAGADYRARIFTPTVELPFAGHPTLGAAFAFVAAGGAVREGVVVQECGVGLVPVRVEGVRVAFRAPEMRRDGALSEAERAEALALLGIDEGEVIEAVHADNGPPWKLFHLRDVEVLRAVTVTGRGEPGTDLGLVAPSDLPGVDWEVRAFFAKAGGVMAEDPVTGSLNAGVARYLYGRALAQGEYVAAQGMAVGADGRVYVRRDEEGIWIGGAVRMVVAGGELDKGLSYK